MAILIEQVAGEVPPLGFEFAVCVVVPGKFESPARLCDFPITSENIRDE
jgi:hypothetical protein